MAVTLIASPSSRSEVGITLRWTFNMTGIAAHPVYRKFGYQFLDSSGAALGSPEAFTPIEGVNFYIDFVEDAKLNVSTEVSDFEFVDEAGPGLVATHSKMRKQVKLKYWEIVTDLENCPSTIEGEMETDNVAIYNTASSRFFKARINTTNFDYFFNYKPSFIHCSKNFKDLIFLSGTGTLNYKEYRGNTEISDVTIPFSHIEVKSYAIGPGNIGIDDSITSVKCSIIFPNYGKPNFLEFTYIIDCYDKVYQLWFQSLLGGYSGIELLRDEVAVSSEFIETQKYDRETDNALEKYHTNGGFSMQNKSMQDKLRLSKQIDNYTEKEVHFLRDFASSSNYIIMLENHEGDITANKIIIEPNIVIENDNLTLNVSAKMSKVYKTPNSSYKSL
jgi:hypothetical protein